MAGATTLATAFAKIFGLRLPVIQAPMATVAGPRMVAAVANAGGMGNLPLWSCPTDVAQHLIQQTRALTAKPFAVNLRADLVQEELITLAADEGVAFFNLFWGSPAASMAAIRRGKGQLIATIGNVDGAKEALDAGAAALIAQGVEAGGHVYGTTPLVELVPAVVQLAGDVPVVAAGAIVEATDIARAFELGASGVVLGSALLVTDEADVHPEYRQAMLDAKTGDTVLSTCFDGLWPDAPHRVLVNSTYRMWRDAGFPEIGSRPGEGDIVMHTPGGMPIERYSAATAVAGVSGEIEAAALYAGEGVGRIKHITSTDELLRHLFAETAAG